MVNFPGMRRPILHVALINLWDLIEHPDVV